MKYFFHKKSFISPFPDKKSEIQNIYKIAFKKSYGEFQSVGISQK